MKNDVTPTPAKTEAFLNYAPVLIDIETDSLRADFGIVFCIVARRFWNDKRTLTGPKIWRIDIRAKNLQKAEGEMLRDFRYWIDAQAVDALISFYGSRFDVPFLNTRLLMHGYRPLPRMRHLDIYFTAKRFFQYVVTSKRMGYIAKLIHEGDSRSPMKSEVDASIWRKVKFERSEKGLDAVVKHCVADIDVLETQVRKLRAHLPVRIPIT